MSAPLRQVFADVQVIQVGPLTRRETYRRLARADAAVISLDRSSAVESRVPAKIYDYLAVGTPVIAMCPPDAALLQVPGAERFHHFEPGSIADLASFLRRAHNDRSTLRSGLPGAGPNRDDGVEALHRLLCQLRERGS